MRTKLPLLIVATFFLWFATPAQAQIVCDAGDPSTTILVQSNTYKVTFCGSNYDSGANQTMFTYKVEEVSGQDLSHWTLALCQLALGSYVFNSATGPGVTTLGQDGSRPITGIKWDLEDEFSEGEFSFKLAGNFSTTDVDVLAKGGTGTPSYTINSAAIPGPSCVVNECANPQAPSYGGGYELNNDGTKAFVKVEVPEGATKFEFYNTDNLAVGDPVANKESTTVLPGLTRTGMTFEFSDGNEPTVAYFPITRSDPNTARVFFYLRVTDDCGQVVDVDPSFALTTAAAGDALTEVSLSAQPNPAIMQATIRYGLTATSEVEIVLHDVLGRTIDVLVQGTIEAGVHEVPVNLGSLPAGVYLYRLSAEGRSLTRTLTVVR